MKKIVFLIISILFITGCQVSYDVKLNKDNYNENLSIFESDLDKFSSYNIGEDFEYYDKMPFPKSTDNADLSYNELSKLDKNLLYEKVNNLNNDGITFGITGRSDNLSKFSSSNLINTFGNVNYSKKNKINYIKYSLTSDLLKKYSMVDSITISVFDNNNCVLNSNADKKEGDKYIWTITRDNYLTKSIDFSYSVKEVAIKKNIKDSVRKLDDPMVKFGIALTIIFLFFLLVYWIVISKYNNSNKL